MSFIFVSGQAREPILSEILDQQGEIVKGQRDIANKLASLDGRFKKIESIFEGVKAERPQAPPSEDFDKVHEIPVGDSYVYGPADAAITIVEFADFQCPFCARFHGPVMEAVKAFPKDVKYMIKNFPLSFHQQAPGAARAALAAGEQGRYFEMADLLLVNIRSLNDETFKKLATDLNLDVEKFMNDYTGKADVYDQQIKADLELGNKVDVRGTPTFYINGKKTMARSADAFKQEIEGVLNK